MFTSLIKKIFLMYIPCTLNSPKSSHQRSQTLQHTTYIKMTCCPHQFDWFLIQVWGQGQDLCAGIEHSPCAGCGQVHDGFLWPGGLWCHAGVFVIDIDHTCVGTRQTKKRRYSCCITEYKHLRRQLQKYWRRQGNCQFDEQNNYNICSKLICFFAVVAFF